MRKYNRALTACNFGTEGRNLAKCNCLVEDGSAIRWRPRSEDDDSVKRPWERGLLLIAARKKRTDRILRLQHLSHAPRVSVRFLVSGGDGCCASALGPDATRLGTEPEAPAFSSDPSALPPWPSSVDLRLRFPDGIWPSVTGELFAVDEG